jgi:hypothetical protein
MAEYYRVDKRMFAIGETIRTAGHYYDKFCGIAKDIEDALDRERPKTMKLPRFECLFVFESLQVARKHWSQLRDGKLYRVEIERTKMLYRADMAMMDKMKVEAEAGRNWRSLVLDYWNGVSSAEPEFEIMTTDAKVIEIISTSDSERIAHLRERWFQ